MPSKPTALILDDDPSHLKVYAWIAERAGFATSSVLVTGPGIQLPTATTIDVIVMDYRYGHAFTAAHLLPAIESAYPKAPIVVLSELVEMPADMVGHGAAFVRKGEPEQLIDTLIEIVSTRKRRAASD